MNKAQELAKKYKQHVLKKNEEYVTHDYQKIVKEFECRMISCKPFRVDELLSKHCIQSLIYYLEQNGFKCQYHHDDECISDDYDCSYLEVYLPI